MNRGRSYSNSTWPEDNFEDAITRTHYSTALEGKQKCAVTILLLLLLYSAPFIWRSSNQSSLWRRGSSELEISSESRSGNSNAEPQPPIHLGTTAMRLDFVLILVLCRLSPSLTVLDAYSAALLPSHDEEALHLLYRASQRSNAWSPLPSDDISLHKCRFEFDRPPSYLNDADRVAFRRHECVRGIGIINAPPEAIFEAFRDNAKILEFNDNIQGIQDLHTFPLRVTEDSVTLTKVSWSKASPRNIPFVKPREFYSIVSFTKFRNGTYVIINRPAYLLGKPKDSLSVRGSLLLSGNIIEPYQNRTKITQVIHINPGGSADSAAIAWIINRRQLSSYVFIKSLERVVLADMERSQTSMHSKDRMQSLFSGIKDAWEMRARMGHLSFSMQNVHSFKRKH